MLNTNIVVIELGDEEGNLNFFLPEDMYKYLVKMNIALPDQYDEFAFPKHEELRYTLPEYLWNASLGNITGVGWMKVWINAENGYILAWQDYYNHFFSEKFTNYMTNLPPLENTDLPCNLGNDNINSNLDLDTILEKIFSQGIESLSMDEIYALRELSKDL